MALTTPAFGKTVGFFGFFGLAVPLLGFAVGFTTAGIPKVNTKLFTVAPYVAAEKVLGLAAICFIISREFFFQLIQRREDSGNRQP